MKRLMYTLIALLGSLGALGQTNQPLPPDAQPLTALTYLSPSDSTVWLYNERSSLAINVGVWADVVELFNQKWSNAQIDSAIAAQIGGINFPVTSVQGMTGAIMLSKADIGLGNVDNTSDANKPISTATQDALNLKENAFSKGSLVAGTGVTLSGTLANRLVGSGNVTVNATPADLGNYVQKTGDIMTGPLTITGSTGSETFKVERTGGSGGSILLGKGGSGTPLFMVVSSLGGGTHFNFSGASSWNFDTNITAPNLVTFNRTTNGFVPAPGGSGTTRFLREDMTWGVPSGGGGGGTATDLSIQNRTASSLDIGSSTGTAATVPARTSTLAGLMLPADLAAIGASTQSLSFSDGGQLSITGSNTLGIYSLARLVADDFNAYTPSSTGFYSLVASGSAVGYPSAGGNGFYFRRNPGNTTGSWAMYFTGNNESVHINTGNGSGYNGWRTLWHSGNFSPSDYVSASNFTWANLSGKPSVFPPEAHTHNASDIDAGTLAAARIGNATVSNVKLSNMAANTIKGRSGTTGAPQDLTAAQVRSLINVADGATANNSNSFLLSRANHTGTQAISTVSGLQPALDSRWINSVSGDWNSTESAGAFRTIASAADAPTGTTHYGAFFPSTTNDYGVYLSGRSDRFFLRSLENSALLAWREVWHSGNLPNPASTGTGSTQVRNNSQLDSRYLQSVSGGSGVNVSGSTISVDNTVLRTTGNQTKSGTLGVTNIMGTSTTASSSIPTNAQSLFTASVSSNTSYTLTNLTGNPRHVQVKVVNTGSGQITVTFNARFPVNQTTTIDNGQTAIFTFLIENGIVWGTKTAYTSI